MEEVEIVRDEFEKYGLHVTVNKKYDISREMSYFRVYTYVGEPPDREKFATEINILDSVYDSPSTEHIIAQKANESAEDLQMLIIEIYVKGNPP